MFNAAITYNLLASWVTIETKAFLQGIKVASHNN